MADTLLSVERELGRAGAQRRLHPLAFRLTHLPEPAVLQRGEQRHQADEQHDHRDERRPDASPHGASLAPPAASFSLAYKVLRP